MSCTIHVCVHCLLVACPFAYTENNLCVIDYTGILYNQEPNYDNFE